MHIRIRKWVKIVFILIILISTFFLYSRYIGTKGFVVKEYSIIDSKVPDSFYGVKIIQISDIHYKVTTTKNDLIRIVKDINLLKPDIVILSGDLFDNSIKYTNDDYNDLKNILKSINYNIDKYAIKGEQDLSNNKWEEIIQDGGFRNLNDTYDTIYYESNNPILLIGISSNYENNHIKNTLDDIYSKVNKEFDYNILVLHEPDFIDEINTNKFNLILAGHSHNGYIVLPFIGGIINNKYSNKYNTEYYEINKTRIYISGGIGTNRYKLRFLNKPSYNLYRLRNK